MKIYSKIVISMITDEVILEESFEYSGAVALCVSDFGGGGDTTVVGGGGTSGAVDYPIHMKDQHFTWLTDIATTTANMRVGDTPYISHVAYNPSIPLASMSSSITNYSNAIDNLHYTTDWEVCMRQAESVYSDLFGDTYVNADIAAYANIIDDQIDNITIPKFQRGLQDINAVQSSSFVLGEALIYGFRDRDVAKYGSDLRLKMNFQQIELISQSATQMIAGLMQKVDFIKAVTHFTIEYNRMYIVAQVDKNKTEIELDELDATWDVKTYAYGSNVMASIAGAAVAQGTPAKSQMTSALASGMSGAAAGGSVGGWWGAAIGGAAGFISEYLK